MRSMLARFWAALGVGHAVGVLTWVAAAALVVPGVARQHLTTMLDGPSQAMVDRLADADDAERAAMLEGWAPTPARLSAPLPLAEADAVRAGELVVEVGFPSSLAYRAVDEDTWLIIGPTRLMAEGGERRWALLALLATVGIWGGAWVAFRPVARTLEHLARVARAFGDGDLSARARVSGPVELEQVGAAFDAMADRIDQLLRVQQETLQGVSHELRTPLTRARFALELVADTDDAVERRALADRADGDLDQMERLLGELLAYLRLDALRDLAPTPSDLRELALEVAEQRVPVDVVGEGSAEVEAVLLRRALRNLVANGARHAESRVVVRVAVAAGVARLDVDDDGPGIPAPDRDRLLLPFRRGEAARALDPTGCGLGLPIAARVVRAHGGSLEIGASPLGGASVSLVFPARSHKLTIARATPAEPPRRSAYNESEEA